MTAKTKRPRSCQVNNLTDEELWQAVLQKDGTVSEQFVYAVKTTGVYCRSDCPARLPLRKNVAFFATPQEAQAAGYRACRRCQPDRVSLAERHAEKVAQACRLIETAETPFPLNELAEKVGLSAYHFHRLFKAQTGVTPKAYSTAHRNKRVRESLSESKTVTEAIYAAGYNSNSRFYESSNASLGMSPNLFRDGGGGTTIRFALGECWLGTILVAASEKGICAILLGDDPETLIHDLEDQFDQAELIGGDADFEKIVAMVVGFVNDPTLGLDLPLDIRGTAFQQRVWAALRQIPVGSTATYTEIAERIGQPKSVRAVAGACAANTLAVAIPCHRVIRTDGSLSGYRWGIERKGTLLQREQELA